MIADAWIDDFITELCKLHPEVLDWPSHEITDIIEHIESRASNSRPRQHQRPSSDA